MGEEPDFKRRFALGLGIATLTSGAAALAAAVALGDEPGSQTAPVVPKEKSDRLAGLPGLKLRVVKPGELVTQEFNGGRLTLVVDANSVIQQAYIG